MLITQKYGKDKVRVVKVTHLSNTNGLKHQHVQELICRVLLSGDRFESSYSKADNSLVVPTDTVKNTVYFLAKKSPKTLENIEVFALDIIAHFLAKYDHVQQVDVDIEALDWTRIPTTTLTPTSNSSPGTLVTPGHITSSFKASPAALTPHPHSFYRAGEHRRTTSVVGKRNGSLVQLSIESGVKDLYILKTTGSSFEGYHKDELTTLPPMAERVFSTMVASAWTFPSSQLPISRLQDGFSLSDDELAKTQKSSKKDAYVIPYNRIFESVTQITLDMFANHDSPSVQNTLYLIGEQVLRVCSDVKDISYALPNKHVFTYDLGRFGIKDNQTGQKSTVYYPVADPSGLITATIGRPVSKL